jgi:hypothetical protein
MNVPKTTSLYDRRGARQACGHGEAPFPELSSSLGAGVHRGRRVKPMCGQDARASCSS